MKHLKSLLAAAALSAIASAAWATNVPLMTGPFDPGNALGTINGWITGSLNPYEVNVIATLQAPVTSSGTSKIALMSWTLPGGTLNNTTAGIRIHAFGVNSGDANAKTVTFDFGASSCAIIVTGSANNWTADFVVYKTGASTQTSECHGMTNTTNVASAQATNWAVTDTAAIAMDISATAATSGTMTLNGAIVEAIH